MCIRWMDKFQQGSNTSSSICFPKKKIPTISPFHSKGTESRVYYQKTHMSNLPIQKENSTPSTITTVP